jgi:hypothetical protein
MKLFFFRAVPNSVLRTTLLLATVLFPIVVATGAEATSTSILIAPTGEAAEDRFGFSVSTAGDVNGDGFSDLIVGAYLNDAGGTDAGRAYVYYGGPGADTTPDLIFTGEAAGDNFGKSVSTAGDVNGDGFSDLIVGANHNNAGGTKAGRAYVYYGGPGADTTPDLTFTGEAAYDSFGRSVSTAGDVNGDGFSDLIVGAYLNDAGDANAGRAYVYYGGPGADTSPDLTLTGENVDDDFGFSVSTAEDVNGDGFSDLIVGAYNNSAGGLGAGRAYVYYGGSAADTIPDLTLTGEGSPDRFGYSVSSAGDVNGDGFSDFIVYAVMAQRAYVYYGGPEADTTPDLIILPASGDQCVSGAGDVNSDGFDDLIVGDSGRINVYYGGPEVDTTPDLTLTGEDTGDQFGSFVSTAGDVDGDGFSDLIVGAWGNDAGGAEAGRAYIYSVFPYQLMPPGHGGWVSGQPVQVRWKGHDVADLRLSVDGGLTWSLLAAQVGGDPENEITVTAPGVTTKFALLRLTYMGEEPATSNSVTSTTPFPIISPSPEPACRLQLAPTGEAAGDRFGSASTAGDVNGDGFSDFIVGAYDSDAGNIKAGRAYVYYGGPGADTTPDLTFTGESAGDYFGRSVSTAGDVNGDGFSDLIVGAYLNDAGGTDAGGAYVYYGGPGADTIPDLTFIGEAAGDNFGRSVSTAGDVNGDGFSDLIVGAYYNDAGGANAGRAYVYYGGPGADTTPDLTFTGEASNDYFGSSVSTAGDVNGDGFSDLIVGAFYNDAGGANAGRAYVYYGGSAADTIPDLTLTGESAGDYFGRSVSTAGDVNGDGFSDLIVGAYGNDAGGAGAGRAYVYYGGPGADSTPDLTFTGEASTDYFGYSVSTAGDVNGDGFSDLIVGAYLNDSGGASSGRAYVYYGGPGGSATPDLTLNGEAVGDNFGGCVSTAGDVNGDGFSDLIVGAEGNDAVGDHAGRAYVYDCNRYHVLDPSGGDVWNVGATETISWLGEARADVWLSTDGGNSYAPLRANVGGTASNAFALVVPHQPTRFSRIRITPHDASILGMDESDSLFTIEASVALLNLSVKAMDGGGMLLSWGTDPGPEDLAGYKVERAEWQSDRWRVLTALTRETSYRDVTGGPGDRYRLSAVNGLGEELVLGEAKTAPKAVLAAWPSPYREGSLEVSFWTAGGPGGAAAPARVDLYDVNGRLVRTLADGDYTLGYQAVTWDGRDGGGRQVASGVYFLESRSGASRTHVTVVIAR